MEHPDIDRCILYVSGLCPDDSVFEMDAHIAKCEECLERIRALLFLKNNFDGFFGAWGAEDYIKACRRLKHVQRLIGLSESASAMAGRIRAACESIAGGGGIAVKALISHSKKIASLFADRETDGYSYRLIPAFSGVGTPESASLQEKIDQGSQMLLRGDLAEAEKILCEVSAKNGRCIQSGIMEVFDGSERVVRVVADSRKRSALVMYWGKRGKPAPECACLMPDEDGDPILAEFLPVEGADYMLAEFRDIPDGTYDIIF